jgi:hypothetical protein
VGGETPMLEEGIGHQDHEGVVVQPMPRPALEVVEPEFFLPLLVRLLADPARLDRGGQRRKGGPAGKLARWYLRSLDARCSPTSQTSSPGRCWLFRVRMRTGGPSATRTRVAAKEAASGPRVPVRHCTGCQSARASMSSAARASSPGMAVRRGRPVAASGQTIATSAG